MGCHFPFPDFFCSRFVHGIWNTLRGGGLALLIATIVELQPEQRFADTDRGPPSYHRLSTLDETESPY
jgi:hypothetical protein